MYNILFVFFFILFARPWNGRCMGEDGIVTRGRFYGRDWHARGLGAAREWMFVGFFFFLCIPFYFHIVLFKDLDIFLRLILFGGPYQ